MALKATIHRAELDIADIDRGYYANHAFTLARHPSETEERLMLRLLAWALHADPALEFGRGLSTEEDPDLWLREPDGTIASWIEVGLPEERRLRRAAGRAKRVEVLAYGGRGAIEPWRERTLPALARTGNLTVRVVAQEESRALAALCDRNMRLQLSIQEAQVIVTDGTRVVTVEPRTIAGH